MSERAEPHKTIPDDAAIQEMDVDEAKELKRLMLDASEDDDKALSAGYGWQRLDEFHVLMHVQEIWDRAEDKNGLPPPLFGTRWGDCTASGWTGVPVWCRLGCEGET